MLRSQMVRVAFLVLLVATLATSASAQFPDKYTNLQVLPKDTSKDDLQAMMRNFTFALGVRCDFCHVQGADKKLDFASDGKEEKKTARLMMQMAAAINHDYMNKLGKSDSVRVECITCHRGLTVPRPLKDVLAQAIDSHGIDAAIATYHDLRKQYFGSGQYDFGETQLDQLTEMLLHKNQNKEAVAIMELNFAENNATSLYSYHMLAMAHQANGENQKALEDFRKDLQAHPEDSWAKSQIDELSKPK